MRASALVPVLLLVACSLGERGGKQDAAAEGEAAAKDVGAATDGPTCESTVKRLMALSIFDAQAKGKPWSTEVRKEKYRQYLERCNDEIGQGLVTRESMECVAKAVTLESARACLMAALPK